MEGAVNHCEPDYKPECEPEHKLTYEPTCDAAGEWRPAHAPADELADEPAPAYETGRASASL